MVSMSAQAICFVKRSCSAVLPWWFVCVSMPYKCRCDVTPFSPSCARPTARLVEFYQITNAHGAFADTHLICWATQGISIQY